MFLQIDDGFGSAEDFDIERKLLESRLLRSAIVAFGSVNTVGQFARHPQLRRTDIDTPTGPVSIPAPRQIFAGEDVALGDSPAVGAHGEAIRREFAGLVAKKV